MVTIDGAKFAAAYGLEMDDLRKRAASFRVDEHGNVIYRIPLCSLLEIITAKVPGQTYSWRE